MRDEIFDKILELVESSAKRKIENWCSEFANPYRIREGFRQFWRMRSWKR